MLRGCRTARGLRKDDLRGWRDARGRHGTHVNPFAVEEELFQCGIMNTKFLQKVRPILACNVVRPEHRAVAQAFIFNRLCKTVHGVCISFVRRKYGRRISLPWQYMQKGKRVQV